MNKQEQIEKMAQQGRDELIAGNYQGKNDIERLCKALHKIGYINGADFVEWLKMKLKQEQDNAGNVPSHALSICKGLERAIDIIDKSLQEYLKGERV